MLHFCYFYTITAKKDLQLQTRYANKTARTCRTLFACVELPRSWYQVRERWCVRKCLSRECSLVAPSGETWTREFWQQQLCSCVCECAHTHVRIMYQFRSPVGSLDAKVTGEYWPSDLSFSRQRLSTPERLAKLDSREIISQVCTKTINNRALLASRSPFCTWTALFIEQPCFFIAQACRRLLHQIGLWVLDSFNLIKNAFTVFCVWALETIILYCLCIFNIKTHKRCHYNYY